MITTSESAVTITIWVLTAAGTFFGTRAVWRRRKQRCAVKKNGSQDAHNDDLN